MSDIIQLLPDAIANQIAAGEVIQRPASVVKELIENAVDAESSSIKLLIKNAGKLLIQVIDDGIGMSATDARMSFEKHATSKIKNIEDLFAISTKGFRGEALASIGAVAQVSVKTKTTNQELGTHLSIESSKVLSQESCACEKGTSIAVQNLFFNIPARRNFLKSDTVETKHIVEEFYRIALAHPEIAFSMYINDQESHHLKASNLRQRVVALMGDSYNEKLVPIKEETDVVSIHGFIGKPSSAKKSRGDQYIFVNNRFIKSNYLNHAIYKAYENILPKDKYPLFVLFLNIDPSKIDINVHPSKHEVKFEEERIIYTLVNAAARHGLAQHSVSASIDFDQEDVFNQMGSFSKSSKSFDLSKSPLANAKTDFPFSSKKEEGSNMKNWEDLYAISKSEKSKSLVNKLAKKDLWETENAAASETKQPLKPLQIHNRFILSSIKSGYILVHQQNAHQRILFEQFLQQLNHQNAVAQKRLFPQTIEISASEMILFKELKEDILKLGFEVEPFGKNNLVIHAFPADIVVENEEAIFQEFFEQFNASNSISSFSAREKVAQSLAKTTSIKQGKKLSEMEMQNIIDSLFACSNPYTTALGKKTFEQYTLDNLEKLFL